MQHTVDITDDAYEVAQTYAVRENCSIGVAVSRLVSKAGVLLPKQKTSPSMAVRFPLVKSARSITSEDVASLQDQI